MNANVIAEWQVVYADPLTFRAAEAVTLGQRDTEWPGWIWCVNSAGKGGWAPEQFIEIRDRQGLARQDYTAAELAVKVGEHTLSGGSAAGSALGMRVGQRVNGWAWCTNANGESGWVPERNLSGAEA